ncbi:MULTISPECIES: DUF1134 domain-containing protein [Spongiibacter]|uniref:DUF1134 domain-containing protein n=1 Tax=Spongiibacter TaxID=630749 RepID=UPI000C640A92|nr:MULTISPECIES: DUF1134 domain-containing protein [Spongiibacter]MBO6753753.1 DUF1134 domain-containing protein [Spongiibacter sp.]MBU71956.1 hypothetical protein [Spongiibacter sp.]|tara:strand:- start:15368 stop:15943 length:576 start_codon:yes stop_codon:yes gene_type:complete
MPYRQWLGIWLLLVTLLPLSATAEEGAEDKNEGFSKEQVMEKAGAFFGETSKGLASAIEKVFEEQGEPNAIVVGEEVSAAIVVGLRYGRGELQMLDGETRAIFWQGPSVGFDMGGNASKVFTLIYNLDDAETLYQRFPGVEGGVYYAAGVGVNYLRSGDTVVAPIRTGVGLRTGANVGYLQFTKEASWNPF